MDRQLELWDKDQRPKRPAVLVSRCLLGVPCRYHGQTHVMGHRIGRPALIAKLQKDYRLIDVCPEVDAGMPTPRPRTDIVDGRWISAGKDVTDVFRKGTDRLYAGLDELLPHKEAIEKHLKQRLGQLFDLDYELLLYDVTSTYFEGQCKGNPQAKRGYSRDKRPDCLQVCIALVVTTDGMPLGYEVFAGNRHDSTTVEEIVETMENKHGQARRIWVMDRGMVSESNWAFVRGREGRYIVGTPKASLRTFEADLVEKKDWDEVEAGVEVKLVSSPDGEETFILARSAERREKERAIHERFLQRMEEPDTEQKLLLHRLGITLPKRLGSQLMSSQM